MNRNSETRFALLPDANIQRSTFERPQKILTSFNVGELIPFYVDEVLPADTMQIKTSKVVRTMPMVTSPYDDLFLDTYYFFCPSRLVWSHWKEFMGENTDSAWIPTTEYTIPQLEAPSGGFDVGTVADYLGIPTGVSNISVNALPFRAIGKIVDDWFRDENLVDPIYVPLDDTTVTGVNTGTASDFVKGGKPFKVAKYHDYFTSALPSPQKGPDVTLRLLDNAVVTGPNNFESELSPFPLQFATTKEGETDFVEMPFSSDKHYKNFYVDGTRAGGFPGHTGSFTHPISSFADNNVTPTGSTSQQYDLIPANLSVNDEVVSINQLRTAFQIQRLYERDARSGSRYVESIKAHFGVTSPDFRLQRTEYLGGNRINLNINSVLQTSSSDTESPQGNVAGNCFTADTHGDFIYSATEHGFIIGLMCVRYHHTYQQGIERMFSRQTRFDYYYPVLANLGEQAILNKEIYADGSNTDMEVFGYQERWAEYRYKPNRVSGQMRSSYAQSLDMWHFADDYDSCPALSAEWIAEDMTNVDRVLSVSSTISNQLFADIYVENTSTRPMPMYSIPGMLDHN